MLQNTMNLQDIYKNLNFRHVSEKEFERIDKSIKENYNIINDVSFYNPNLNFFSNYFTSDISFNNHNKLYKLLQKKERVSTIGFYYKAAMKNKNNNIFYKKIFMKEIPIFSAENIDLYNEDFNYLINPLSKKINDNIYSYNSPLNIEIFVNYLISKLVELDISPSFCEFYGVYSIIMKRFTYDISDSPELITSVQNIIEKSNNNIRLIKNNDEYFLENKNVPSYLLATESGGFDLSTLGDIFDYEMLISITFQVFSAIINMNQYFGIKHNDLHFGNIMLKETDKKFFYYRLKDKTFKIPTYGFVVKIIDWGRSNYNFNDFKGDSDIYRFDSECFGQYIYQKINYRGKKPIKTDMNRWTDIVMMSYSILHEYPSFKNTALGKLLKKIITSDKKEVINTKEFSWTIYKDITNKNYNIIPKNLFLSRVFEKFITKESDIETQKVYDILL